MRKKLRVLVLALSLLFTVSLTVLAVGNDYDLSSDLRRMGDEEGRGSNAIRAELITPSEYLSAGYVETESIYYFELQTEMDSSKDLDFYFWFKGTSCTPNETKSKTNFMPYFKVYNDASLSSDSLVASYENGNLVWDSHNQEGIDTTSGLTANEAILHFHITTGTLEPNSNYYLVMEKDIVNPKFNATMKLPGDAVYRFKTKAIKAGREVSEGTISTSNGASFRVTPSFVTNSGEKSNPQLFINYDSKQYEIDENVPYLGDFELNITMTPDNHKKNSHLIAYVCDPEKPEKKLQEFNIADDTVTAIEDVVLSVTTDNLELGKTYHLVLDKVSQSGDVLFGEDVVFQFQTHKHSPKKLTGYPSGCEGTGLTDGEECASCGALLTKQEEIPALGHDWVDVPATDATCTTSGLLPYQKCSRCGSTSNKFPDQTKPPLGHVSKVTKEGTVTCTEAGLCEEITCERCNQILQQQKEVSALGHDYVDGVCSRCGVEAEFADYAEDNWQGETISIHWTTPEKDCIRTQGLLKNSEGDQYYYNEFSEPFCANTTKTFAFEVKGGGAVHMDPAKCCEHINVYSDASLSAESLVASADENTIVDVKRNDPTLSDGLSNVEFTIASGALENDKDYYIVIDKDLPSNNSRTMGVSVVTKISTKHGETEEIPAFHPTCTDAGREAGVMCKECKTYVEGGKEIPATGHTEVTIPGKPATCTETGLTDGKKCSVCNETLTEQKEIAVLGHKFENGTCTRCGEADPDYKPTPEEPDEPTPVEPVTKFTGLANEADKDGNWWYYTDGEIDKTHTGVDKNKYGWWRVENGKVNFKAQGIYKNAYGWWKTTDGEVTFKENSIYQNEYGWWKCKDSKVDFNAQSIYQNQYGWWKTTNGKVTFKENGLFKNQYGTWKVENSKVNFNYNGTYQGKTIKNGKVQ